MKEPPPVFGSIAAGLGEHHRPPSGALRRQGSERANGSGRRRDDATGAGGAAADRGPDEPASALFPSAARDSSRRPSSSRSSVTPKSRCSSSRRPGSSTSTHCGGRKDRRVGRHGLHLRERPRRRRGEEEPPMAAAARKGAARRLTDSEMVSLCTEFLNGGTDTTVTLLEWIMAELVNRPDVQAKVYEEVKANPELSDLQAMPYLKAAVLEGLRLHPPVHFLLPHGVQQGGDAEIGGYKVPDGAEVNFLVAEMGRDEAVWTAAREFRPERFLEGAEGHGVDITGSREIKMMRRRLRRRPRRRPPLPLRRLLRAARG